MIRIDFIQWDLLWTASPTVTFSSYNILQYSNNGEAIADLYFNQADASYMDFVIDWNDISAYWDYKPLPQRYPFIWRYGAKIYNNDTLIYTGVIFLDTVKINKEAFRFAFTVLSTTGFLSRANENYTYAITGTTRQISELVSPSGEFSLFSKALTTPFAGISGINRPSFTYDGRTIMSPFSTNMVLPHYDNSFPWDYDYDFDWSGGSYTDNIRVSVGIYRIHAAGILPIYENKLCLFMFQERYNASSPFMYECRCLIIIINGLGNYSVYKNVHHKKRNSSAFNIRDYNLYSIVPNADEWLSAADSAEYSDGNVFIQWNNGYWLYTGVAEIDSVSIDPDNAEVNPFRTLSDLLFLRQSAMVNDAAGNVVCKIRPILNDPQGSVSITNSVIGSPSFSGVFIKSVANNIGLDFILNIDDVLNYIKQYFQTILNWYRVKLNITIDGSVNVGLGIKIMYNNQNYIVTRTVSDYDNFTTEIEAYGEV